MRKLVFAATVAMGAPLAAFGQDAARLGGELAQLLDRGRIEELRAAMAAAGKPVELAAASAWARDALLAGRAGGSVALSYAEVLGRLGEWEEQRRWFAYGMLLLQVDGTRCAAEDVARGKRQTLAAPVEEGMADFRRYPDEARRLAIEEAARTETDTRSRRQPDGWLCGGKFAADEDWRRALPGALAEAKAALLK